MFAPPITKPASSRAPAAPFAAPVPFRAALPLQRKCDCGAAAMVAGDKCEQCARSGPGLQRALTIGASDDPLEREADRIAEQVLAAPARSGASAAPPRIQRATGPAAAPAGEAPASVMQTLGRSGEPLDAALRQDMEQRFGRDFSQVRIHRDGAAAQSAFEAGARAYTAGNNIVFGQARFQPQSAAGRRLLAHELVHIVQQREPRPLAGFGLVQRQDKGGDGDKGKSNEVDDTAKKIIAAGKDTKKPVEERAVAAVNAIVKAYYDPKLVEEVVYQEDLSGLMVSPVKKGSKDSEIKGKVSVGKYFIDNIGSFARRVLQVGHELEHVKQQRAGMGGKAKQSEREFLAFHWEATEPEKAGTGRMSHSTRVALIDEALKNYYCMPEDRIEVHKEKKDALLGLRETEQKASGHDPTSPPDTCSKSK